MPTVIGEAMRLSAQVGLSLLGGSLLTVGSYLVFYGLPLWRIWYTTCLNPAQVCSDGDGGMVSVDHTMGIAIAAIGLIIAMRLVPPRYMLIVGLALLMGISFALFGSTLRTFPCPPPAPNQAGCLSYSFTDLTLNQIGITLVELTAVGVVAQVCLMKLYNIATHDSVT